MIGSVPGVATGAWFEDRTALRASGIHRPPQAGICGTAAGGAESIVLAGGYVDDEDTGDEIIYTGAGGNDRQTRRQTAHQTAGGPNAALVTSWQRGLPVRVVRGRPRASVLRDHPRVVFAPPETGYRYDGLYLVTDYWTDVGADGFRVLRFRLERLPTDEPVAAGVSEPRTLFGTAARRRERLVSHVVRDPAVVLHVKRLHRYCCQVCGRSVETPTGPYAEGAHIRPLGRPHDGPDESENVLCLCPNHHIAFDRWAFALAADLSLVGLPGRLRTTADHTLVAGCLAYRRRLFDAAQSDAARRAA